MAHGAFRLRHPQSEFGIAATDNLMHNTDGTRLRKYQWDNIHDPESMVGWFQDDEESELAYCNRCPKPDHVGKEGESAVTFDPDPANVKKRGAKRWYYFSGYSESPSYSAPDNIGETAAGWYDYDDYLRHIEPVIESISIVSGDVVLHPSNAAGILQYRENLLVAFESGREIGDNFKKLVAQEYGRVTKEAFNKYSGSGHVEPIYPIYEVLGLFTGKQLVRGVVKFGNTFRALKNVKNIVNYRFSDDVLKIFTKKGDEVGKVIDGNIQPVKYLDEGEEIAEVGGQKLLKQGDEVGFSQRVWKAVDDEPGSIFNANIANSVEREIPGKITGIDQELLSITTKKRISDIDINFDNKVWVEVKSGTSNVKMNQITKQINASKAEQMKYVYYAEDLSKAQRNVINTTFKEQVKIIETKTDLIEYLKKIQ